MKHGSQPGLTWPGRLFADGWSSRLGSFPGRWPTKQRSREFPEWAAWSDFAIPDEFVRRNRADSGQRMPEGIGVSRFGPVMRVGSEPEDGGVPCGAAGRKQGRDVALSEAEQVATMTRISVIGRGYRSASSAAASVVSAGPQ